MPGKRKTPASPGNPRRALLIYIIDSGPTWEDLRKSQLREDTLNARVAAFWEKQQREEQAYHDRKETKS